MVTNRVRIDPFGPTFHIIFVPLLSYDSLVILFFVFMIFRIIWFNINSALFQLTQCYKCLKYMSSRRYFYIFLQNKSLIDFVCWGILIPYIHNIYNAPFFQIQSSKHSIVLFTVYYSSLATFDTLLLMMYSRIQRFCLLQTLPTYWCIKIKAAKKTWSTLGTS